MKNLSARIYEIVRNRGDDLRTDVIKHNSCKVTIALNELILSK